MKTTAIYPNRIEDKNDLENSMSLEEFGDGATEFYAGDELFAVGYARIVYGDHGPYVEFDKEHIQCFLKGNKFDELPEENEIDYYYIWLHPDFDKSIKVYLQLKPVSDKPNAPARADGKKSTFNRKEGYADYRRGLYYVDPYQLTIRQ